MTQQDNRTASPDAKGSPSAKESAPEDDTTQSEPPAREQASVLRLGPEHARDPGEPDAATTEKASSEPTHSLAPAPVAQVAPPEPVTPATEPQPATTEAEAEDAVPAADAAQVPPEPAVESEDAPSEQDDAPAALVDRPLAPDEPEEPGTHGEGENDPERAPEPAAGTARDPWAIAHEDAPDLDTDDDTDTDTKPQTEPHPPETRESAPSSPEIAVVNVPSVAPPVRPRCDAALFGKLPARGDFIERNMPRSLQRPFEDWLIPLVQQTRTELGGDWDHVWRGAGPWRFWIGPEVLGGSWQRDLRKSAHGQPVRGGALTGVLLPSADRHGRDFPLVVVLADAMASLMPPPVTASPDRGWYDLCDELLYAARSGTDITAIEAALDRLPGPILPEGAEEMAPLLDQRALWAQSMETRADGTSRIWKDIAAADHHLAACHRSYWWQAPRAGATQRVLTLAGLPDAGSFAFMLTQGHPEMPNPVR